MASIGDTTRPEYIYDQATDTWIPVGIGPHSHTPAAIGAISNSLTTTTGDLIYAASANTPARLGIGSTGQVLSVSGGIPAWATVAAGSMTLLSTTALSGSSITLSSISGSYKDLRIQIEDATFSTNNSEIILRYNGDSGANYDMFYNLSQLGISNTNSGYGSLTGHSLNYALSMQSTSTDANFLVSLYDYTNTTTRRLGFGIGAYNKGYTTAGDKIVQHTSLFYNNVGTAITSITILISAGTFSTGTVKLYGVN